MTRRPRFLRIVQLASGGEVSLAIEAMAADLSGPDCAFLLALIDMLDQYQARRNADAQAQEQMAVDQQQRLSNRGRGDV